MGKERDDRYSFGDEEVDWKDEYDISEQSIKVPAKVIHGGQLLCPLPNEQSYIIQVEGSNGGTSEKSLPFFVFDPICFNCYISDSGKAVCYRTVGSIGTGCMSLFPMPVKEILCDNVVDFNILFVCVYKVMFH